MEGQSLFLHTQTVVFMSRVISMNLLWMSTEGHDAPDFLSPLTSTPRPHPSTHPHPPHPSPHPPTHTPHPAATSFYEQKSPTAMRGKSYSCSVIHSFFHVPIPAGSDGMGARGSYPAATRLTLSKDVDDNKYRRKNPMDMISRWIKYVLTTHTQTHTCTHTHTHMHTHTQAPAALAFS